MRCARPRSSDMPPPARAIHADRVNLVQIGHCAMRLGHFDDLAHGADIAIHGIDGFKRHDLGSVAHGFQLAVQIAPVIVLPDHLVCARMTDAFDHAGMVALIRQDDRVGDLGAQSGQCCPVRDIAGCEQRCRFPCRAGRPALLPAGGGNCCYRKCCACRRHLCRNSCTVLTMASTTSG